jgi:AraC family transcriptional regulator
MQAHVTNPVGVSTTSERDRHTWVHHAILLLDTAVRQIDRREESVKRALLRAKSLLRKQVDADLPAAASYQGEQLLAWQARKVRHHIDEHISDTLLVCDLAALLELSEAHFSRSFKGAFGEPPYAFVIRRRLERAIQYMLETDLPIRDIARRCGFADQPHLCKMSRRSMGYTPAAWRRRMCVGSPWDDQSISSGHGDHGLTTRRFRLGHGPKPSA